MQLHMPKIKPPFLLDGVQASKKGKALGYKPEKDIHLEQYFYNMQMRQMMEKIKKDRMSQRNIGHSSSKSFDQTINQSKVKLKQAAPSSNSPLIKSPSKPNKIEQTQPLSRSMSREHFVTFLDSLITTVQNVQQLVVTYFPKEQIDATILKQQNELKKINQATEILTRQLRANSLSQKKEVENVKTQKNFSKLPQIKKISKANQQQSERERGQSTRYRKTPGVSVNLHQKTLEKSSVKNQQEYDNLGFEPDDQIAETSKKVTVELPAEIEQLGKKENEKLKQQQTRSNVTTQLPSFRSSQQTQNQKKYQKEIQLVLTKPKQHRIDNQIVIINNSPDNFKSKSVGNRDNTQKNFSKQYQKFDIKKIGSLNVEHQRSKSQLTNKNVQAKKENVGIQIKIVDVDAESKDQKVSEIPKINIPIEVVDETVQDFSNESGIFQTQVEFVTEKKMDNLQEQQQKLEGTAIFRIAEEDEKKETIGRLTESNDFDNIQNQEKETQQEQDNDDKKQTLNNDSTKTQIHNNEENEFIRMIQQQVNKNDDKLLKQQQTGYHSNSDHQENNQDENLIKAVESIDQKSESEIVNPLEDSDEQKQLNIINPRKGTIESEQKQNLKTISDKYKNENFEFED